MEGRPAGGEGVFYWQKSQQVAESGAGQIVNDAPVDAKYDHLPEHVVW